MSRVGENMKRSSTYSGIYGGCSTGVAVGRPLLTAFDINACVVCMMADKSMVCNKTRLSMICCTAKMRPPYLEAPLTVGGD